MDAARENSSIDIRTNIHTVHTEIVYIYSVESPTHAEQLRYKSTLLDRKLADLRVCIN